VAYGGVGKGPPPLCAPVAATIRTPSELKTPLKSLHDRLYPVARFLSSFLQDNQLHCDWTNNKKLSLLSDELSLIDVAFIHYFARNIPLALTEALCARLSLVL